MRLEQEIFLAKKFGRNWKFSFFFWGVNKNKNKNKIAKLSK
jgi:hypothetical protein